MEKHERRYELHCKNCDRRFYASRKDAQWCSGACSQEHHRNKKLGLDSQPTAAYKPAADLRRKQTKKDDWDDDWDDDDNRSGESKPVWKPDEWAESMKVTTQLPNGELVTLYPEGGKDAPLTSDGKYTYRTVAGTTYDMLPEKVGRRPPRPPFVPTPEQIARQMLFHISDSQPPTNVYPDLDADGEQRKENGHLIWLRKDGRYLKITDESFRIEEKDGHLWLRYDRKTSQPEPPATKAARPEPKQADQATREKKQRFKFW